MIEQEVWEHNITTLLHHPRYKRISKLVGSDNIWVRLNYKDKEVLLTQDNSWEYIVSVCDKLLGNQ